MPARVVVLGRGIERTFVANPLSNAVDRDGPVTVVDPRYALVRTALRLITIRTPPQKHTRFDDVEAAIYLYLCWENRRTARLGASRGGAWTRVLATRRSSGGTALAGVRRCAAWSIPPRRADSRR
jgi:hypothetical protein